ncbi:mitochondrial substrate carrier protein [Chloropicon primus]|uniref:Mitochondrial substrate carrier protein n=1 Tax=Chloropicon primus TaxID=1764295 RepID=A0A5B8MN00_9CHLO|nr:mitochondrial substrate carrier protein [Chloropicon primus]UPQ99892.1 mitochondrial substrate carrier protein [Chloropicon primus]|mmetsp:Transcript_2830/g.7754  ORF Transcript_2830/g.7754 Transcript_2830/m.7754 type:complete len:285 (-) Transcript_2830:130-984(-)|eukprot:QDZ20680.1 mitochondrial substrate carrier protein [Chloropicon primus]
MANKRQGQFSFWEQTVIGGVSGIIEVCCTQPTVAVKNALQEARPIHFTPRFMYTGLVVNAASIAPITAVQFGANRALTPFFSDKNGVLSPLMKLATAGTAGMISSLVSGPAELIMIQQQKFGTSMGGTFKSLVSQKGPTIMGKGLSLAAGRDGLYTCFVLGSCHVITAQAQESFGLSPSAAFTVGGLTSGIGAAIFTHPFDTMKTRVQGNALEPTQKSIPEVFSSIWKEGGVGGFYKGFIARGVRLTAAMFILNLSKSKMEEALDSYKSKSESAEQQQEPVQIL